MVKGVSSQFTQPVQRIDPGNQRSARNTGRVSGEHSFEALLNEKMTAKEVRFSRHAVDRMASRNIQIQQDDLNKINGAVDRAAEKGAKDSLIIIDQHAFVVSVENRMVITAMDKEQLHGNVFTNIDSAVLL